MWPLSLGNLLHWTQNNFHSLSASLGRIEALSVLSGTGGVWCGSFPRVPSSNSDSNSDAVRQHNYTIIGPTPSVHKCLLSSIFCCTVVSAATGRRPLTFWPLKALLQNFYRKRTILDHLSCPSSRLRFNNKLVTWVFKIPFKLRLHFWENCTISFLMEGWMKSHQSSFNLKHPFSRCPSPSHTLTHLCTLHVVAALILLNRRLAVGARFGVRKQPQAVGSIFVGFAHTGHYPQAGEMRRTRKVWWDGWKRVLLQQQTRSLRWVGCCHG